MSILGHDKKGSRPCHGFITFTLWTRESFSWRYNRFHLPEVLTDHPLSPIKLLWKENNGSARFCQSIPRTCFSLRSSAKLIHCWAQRVGALITFANQAANFKFSSWLIWKLMEESICTTLYMVMLYWPPCWIAFTGQCSSWRLGWGWHLQHWLMTSLNQSSIAPLSPWDSILSGCSHSKSNKPNLRSRT